MKMKFIKKKNNKNEDNFLDYEEAKKEFNDHTMNIAKSLHSWKIITFMSMTVTLILVVFVIFLSSRSSLIPYVIEVDETGNAKAINPAYQTNYIPQENQIQYEIRNFIRHTRWLSLDPIVQNEFYKDALNHLDDNMKNKLQKQFDEENISKLIKEKYSRDVNISNTIKLSGTKNTYQAKWKETLYDKDGDIVSSKNYIGNFTINIITPKTVETLKGNPLGIYITDFHISIEK